MPSSKTPDIQEEDLVVQLPEQIDLVDLIDQPAWKSILIELVRKEKMDPWAIDVAELADKYLQKIQVLEKADLRIPANAILASAILLKLKAKTIKLKSLDDLEEEFQEEAKKIAEQQMLLSDEQIPELIGSRLEREGIVSLDELVKNIEEILVDTRKKSSRKLSDFSVPEFHIPFDEKDIEERTKEILERIGERADSQGIVMFSQLLDTKTPSETVSTFIPLLFLFNKDKISLWQEAFWQEIFVSLNGDGRVIV